MCGFVGLTRSGEVRFDMVAALDLLQKRGPDDRNDFFEGDVALGHVRLSVIDLSDNARQPLSTSCGRFVIVYNGEIYNYKEIRERIGDEFDWNSNSDTEVILASYLKWGESCVEHFHGMFAFAIWDKKTSSLFAARDRLGVKPFYYFEADWGLAFCSRPGALRAFLPDTNFDLDMQAVRYFLEMGYVPAPHSIYKKVKKLPPGHTLTFNAGDLAISRYWSLDEMECNPNLAGASEDSLLEELDDLVGRSVRWRMVSDVPIGVFLSGGIDSSLVTAYMAKASSGSVRTFTIGFDDQVFDESRHARLVAEHLHTEHRCMNLTADDLLDLMPDFLSQYDEPFFDYSAFPVMAVSKMARQHVKVALSGDGGDEAFGGYHYYQIMHKLNGILPIPGIFRHALGRFLKFLPQYKIKLLGELLTRDDPATAFSFIRSVIKDNGQVMSPGFAESTLGIAELFSRSSASMPPSVSAQDLGMRLDIAYTLPDDYLQKVDVGSMAFSLEVRDPLLDHGIFEWAARLPSSWKLRGNTNKYLLRKLAYRYIPKEILERPKMGFGVPMEEWLRGPLKDWAEELIADRISLEELGLDFMQVRGLWRQHQSRLTRAHTILWTILVLLAFYRNFRGRLA